MFHRWRAKPSSMGTAPPSTILHHADAGDILERLPRHAATRFLLHDIFLVLSVCRSLFNAFVVQISLILDEQASRISIAMSSCFSARAARCLGTRNTISRDADDAALAMLSADYDDFAMTRTPRRRGLRKMNINGRPSISLHIGGRSSRRLVYRRAQTARWAACQDMSAKQSHDKG